MSRFFCWLLCSGCLLAADFPRQWFLHAHNCYPKHGAGYDRLARARRAGLTAFELDLAWSEARSRTVLSHETKLDGHEPTIEQYFFEPFLPELRKLPAGKPGILLFFDFKSDHPGPVKEVYRLLSLHRDLVTTAGTRGDPPDKPLRFGPLTVILTGDNSAIAQFEKLTPDGEPYLAMGNREPLDRKFQENIENYIPALATAFYRVFNFEWKHIERDPNFQAGPFTPAKRARLQALVKLAHAKGYWLRTWTLNATNADWGSNQNFGSKPAMLERWRAALEVGVEMVVTDEYELAGGFLRAERLAVPRNG